MDGGPPQVEQDDAPTGPVLLTTRSTLEPESLPRPFASRPARPTYLVIAQRAGKTLVALLSVVVLGLTWYGWTMIGNLNEGLATTNVFGDDKLAPKPLDGAMDILLVGQDSRTDAQGDPLPQRVLDKLHGGTANGDRQTDTMILVHIPADGRRASAISFPRDSWVELAGGYGRHKLNGAFVYAYNDTAQTLRQQGETNNDTIHEQATEAGRKNLIATIEQLAGRPGLIDRYAEVNLGSFYEVTKAIGGIDVCLNHAVDDEKSGAKFKKGRQRISGAKALAFVRQRYGLPNGDFDRIVRQQAFISGLARKVLSQDMLTDPQMISDLSAAIKKSVVLSEGWNITEFAQQMQGLTGGNIEFHTIPNEGDAIIGGASVVQIDEQEVREFIGKITSSGQQDGTASGTNPSPQAGSPADPRTAEITVTVYYGSADPTAGTEAMESLSDNGFQRGDLVESSTRERTVIRHPVGEQGDATLVAEALGGQPLLEPDSDVEAGTVRVLLGSDYAGPPESGSGAPDNGTPGSQQPTGEDSPPQPTGNGASSEGAPNDPAESTARQPETLDASEVPCVN